MTRPVLLLLLFGATAGTLLDAMHTFGGATEYTHPFVLRTAWWVPLLFAGAYGFGGVLYALGYARLGGPPRLPSMSAALFGVAVFAGLYAVTAFAPLSNGSKALVLLVCAAGLFFALDRSWQGSVLAIVAAVVGPLTEIALTRLGMFRHRWPDFWGIPAWLPALYLASGPSFGQLARRVLEDQRAPIAR